MTCKKLCLIALACLLLSGAALGETAKDFLRIESAVYDLRIGEMRYDGFCMLTLSAYTPLRELRFSSDSDVELLTEGLRLDTIDGEMRITGFGSQEMQKKVILRLRGKLNDSTDLPFLRFHYRVDNTLVAVTAPKRRYIWNASFSTYAIEEGDSVIASDDYREEDTPKLNSEYLELRSRTTKSLSMPEYRLYLGGIDADQKPLVSPLISGESSASATQTIAVGVLSAGVICTAWLILKKGNKKAREEPRITSGEDAKDNWDERRHIYEKNLLALKEEEAIVYRQILDAGGEMLQKNISESTGYGAVKTTRILNRLEQKRLIERKSYGVTNRVVLR
jgi:uncharacterized membrane protein